MNTCALLAIVFISYRLSAGGLASIDFERELDLVYTLLTHQSRLPRWRSTAQLRTAPTSGTWGALRPTCSWRTGHKLVWDVPRGCHTYLVEEVLAPQVASLKASLLSKFVGFFRSLITSPSSEVMVVVPDGYLPSRYHGSIHCSPPLSAAGKIRRLGKKQPEGLLMLKGGGCVAITSFSLVSWGSLFGILSLLSEQWLPCWRSEMSGATSTGTCPW